MTSPNDHPHLPLPVLHITPLIPTQYTLPTLLPQCSPLLKHRESTHFLPVIFLPMHSQHSLAKQTTIATPPFFHHILVTVRSLKRCYLHSSSLYVPSHTSSGTVPFQHYRFDFILYISSLFYSIRIQLSHAAVYEQQVFSEFPTSSFSFTLSVSYLCTHPLRASPIHYQCLSYTHPLSESPVNS